MKVSDILRLKGATLYTVSPEDVLQTAIGLMAEKDIGSVVVMEHGKLVGLLTFREVLRTLADHGAGLTGFKVRATMHSNPVICTMDTDLDRLRNLMLEDHARYVPIMEGSMLMGVVSFYDVERVVQASQDLENRLLKAYIRDWPEDDSSTNQAEMP